MVALITRGLGPFFYFTAFDLIQSPSLSSQDRSIFSGFVLMDYGINHDHSYQTIISQKKPAVQNAGFFDSNNE